VVSRSQFTFTTSRTIAVQCCVVKHTSASYEAYQMKEPAVGQERSGILAGRSFVVVVNGSEHNHQILSQLQEATQTREEHGASGRPSLCCC
jgi:hypothetical protein